MQISVQKGSLNTQRHDVHDPKLDEEAFNIVQSQVLLPLSIASRAFVSFYFIDRLYSNYSTRISPMIVMSPILPSNADVFSAIERGDMNKLIQLLREGKAHLSTKDQFGRCLLNVCPKASR